MAGVAKTSVDGFGRCHSPSTGVRCAVGGAVDIDIVHRQGWPLAGRWSSHAAGRSLVLEHRAEQRKRVAAEVVSTLVAEGRVPSGHRNARGGGPADSRIAQVRQRYNRVDAGSVPGLTATSWPGRSAW